MQVKENKLIIVAESDRELPPLNPERIEFIKALAFDYYVKLQPTPQFESEARREQKKEIFQDALERGNFNTSQKLTAGPLIIPVEPPLTHPNKSNKIHMEKVFEQKSRFQTNWELRPKSTGNRGQDKENQNDFERWADRKDRQTSGVISNNLDGRLSDPHLILYMLSDGLDEQKRIYTRFSSTKARWDNFVNAMGGRREGRSKIEQLYPTLADQLSSLVGGGDSIEEIFGQIDKKPIQEKQPFFLTNYFFKNPEISKKVESFHQTVEAAEQWENLLPQWSESSHRRDIDRTIATFAAELIGSNDPFSYPGWVTIRKPTIQIETVVSFVNVIKEFKKKERGLEFLAGTIYYIMNPDSEPKPNLASQFTQVGLSPKAIELGATYLNKLISESLKGLSKEATLLEINDDPSNIEPRRRADQLFKLDKVPTALRQSVLQTHPTASDKLTARVVRAFSIGEFATLSELQQYKALQEVFSVEKKIKSSKILDIAKSFGIFYDPLANKFETIGISETASKQAASDLAKIFLKSLFDPTGRLGTETLDALWRISLQTSLPLSGKTRLDEKNIPCNPETFLPKEQTIRKILSEMVHYHAGKETANARECALTLLDCAGVYGLHELLRATSKNGFPARHIVEPDIHTAAQEGWGKVRRELEHEHITPNLIAILSGGGSTTSVRAVEKLIHSHIQNFKSQLISESAKSGRSNDMFPLDGLAQTFDQIIKRSLL